MKLWPPGVFPVHEIREAWRGETAPGKSSESLLEKDAILSAHAIEVGQTVLDAGCGNGYMLKEFSQLVGDGGKVYALDPDETAIALLREETEGTNMVALVGDVTATTQLPASAIDLIYLSTVFHIFSPEQIKGFEADMQRYFRVSPPSVHQMVTTLVERGFIKKTPGRARSISLLVVREQLPDLE